MSAGAGGRERSLLNRRTECCAFAHPIAACLHITDEDYQVLEFQICKRHSRARKIIEVDF